MKVKIIKCSSDLSWYLDKIGQVFNVYDYNKEFYGISNDPKNRLISRENAISVYDGSDDLEYLQKEIKLDLETLKSIKASFSLCSDESARCNGYANLCETIEKMEKKKDERVNFFDAVNKSFNNIFDELPTYKQDPEEEKIYNEKKERQIFKDERLMKKYFKYREVFDEILNELKDKDNSKILASESDAKIFVEAILNPGKPNDNLKKAAEIYKEMKRNEKKDDDDVEIDISKIDLEDPDLIEIKQTTEKDLAIYDLYEAPSGNLFIKLTEEYSIAIGQIGDHGPKLECDELNHTQFVKCNQSGILVKKVGELWFMNDLLKN